MKMRVITPMLPLK